MTTAEPVTPAYPHQLRRLYRPFLALAKECREMVGVVVGSLRAGGQRYTIPRFTFLGPTTNVPQKRTAFAQDI